MVCEVEARDTSGKGDGTAPLGRIQVRNGVEGHQPVLLARAVAGDDQFAKAGIAEPQVEFHADGTRAAWNVHHGAADRAGTNCRGRDSCQASDPQGDPLPLHGQLG